MRGRYNSSSHLYIKDVINLALTTPTLSYVPAFDSRVGHTFTFSSIGGSQVTANKLVIRDNSTYVIEYSETIQTYKLEHTLPASILRNNVYYSATVTTFDASGNESAPSTPVQFWCYSTPTLTFTNLPASGVVENSSFSFDFEYNQEGKEPLNFYKINLYNENKVLLATSGKVYPQDENVPFYDNYIFTGLQDNTNYFVELEGETVNDTKITSGLTKFSVKYSQPSFISVLDVDSICDEGYIRIRSNGALLEGVSQPRFPTYIDDKEVDLRDKDSWVKFDKNFSIARNFLLRALLREPKPNQPVIKLSDTSGRSIIIYYREGYLDSQDTVKKAYLDMYIRNLDEVPYYIYSDFANIIVDTSFPKQYYVIWLRHKNGIFQLDLEES